MKLLAAAVVTALVAPAWAFAQNNAQSGAQDLDLSFPNFAAKAQEKAEVDLDPSTMSQALALSKEDAAPKEAQGALSGVTGVHVRNYKFAADGAYKDSDLEPLRQQVAKDSKWSRIINVQEHGESTQIYILKGDTLPAGLLVISAEPKEVTVVVVLGNIELSRLQEVVKSTIQYDMQAAANASKKQ